VRALIYFKTMKLGHFFNLPSPKLTGANLLNAIGAVVLVYLLVVLGSTIKHNYALDQQVTQLKSQDAQLQRQKSALNSTIQYEQTSSFDDREARSQLGLQAPGEHVVIIPESTPAATPIPSSSLPVQPKSNFQQWLTFLSGRG
jgi:cell division protein FtsB